MEKEREAGGMKNAVESDAQNGTIIKIDDVLALIKHIVTLGEKLLKQL